MPQHDWAPEAAAVFADMDAEEFFGADPTLYDAPHWARFPYWTLDEATALSFNKNPDIVYAAFLKDLPHEFAEAYFRRMALLERAVGRGLSSDKPSPAEIVAWMDQVGLEISNDLFNALRENQPVVAKPMRRADITKIEQTLSRSFLNFAILHYGFRKPTLDCPADQIVRETVAKMTKLPISISQNNLVDKLKKAYEAHSDEINWPKSVN